MIDIRKLKELVRLMVANDLTELDLRDSEEQVTLRRQRDGYVSVPAANHVAPVPVPAGTTVQPAATEAGAAPAKETSADDGLTKVESPMVGTFYAAPDPESPAFINPGDRVTADAVVCLIEAMKIFNEIKAECSGVVERVLVKNGEAVEFGQPLMLVRPE